MIATPLCPYFCGARQAGLFGSLPSYNLDLALQTEQPDLASAEREEDLQPHGIVSYFATADQPLRGGAPIRQGQLWLFNGDEHQAVDVSLYSNGLSYKGLNVAESMALSPFSLVRNCNVQARHSADGEFKCFKVAIITEGSCSFFGVRSDGKDEEASEKERSCWVIDISKVVRLVTQSLFPEHSVTCQPLKAVASTHRRIMAGYLLHHDDAFSVSVLYCELHPHISDEAPATLKIYENELCEALVMELKIDNDTTCGEKIGIKCSCFYVEDHVFSARTLAERFLWIRSISNLKVKLQHEAPSPTEKELSHFRMAISDHIAENWEAFQSHTSQEPLLSRFPRQDTKPPLLWKLEKEPDTSLSSPATCASSRDPRDELPHALPGARRAAEEEEEEPPLHREAPQPVLEPIAPLGSGRDQLGSARSPPCSSRLVHEPQAAAQAADQRSVPAWHTAAAEQLAAQQEEARPVGGLLRLSPACAAGQEELLEPPLSPVNAPRCSEDLEILPAAAPAG